MQCVCVCVSSQARNIAVCVQFKDSDEEGVGPLKVTEWLFFLLFHQFFNI